MRKLLFLALAATSVPALAWAAAGDPSLTVLPPDQRLTGLLVISHAKPMVLAAMVVLLAAVIAAAALWVSQAMRPAHRSGSAIGWLSAIAAGAPMLGLAAAAYGLMDACIGIANVRPVPTLSILAPGLTEAFFCIMLGCLASAVASVGERHLKARLHPLDAAAPADRAASAPLARTMA
jgi:MotA/TolQ/ExbB proton channel family